MTGYISLVIKLNILNHMMILASTELFLHLYLECETGFG